MRIAASLIPFALLPLASASLATDAYKWANDLVSSEDVQSSKHGQVHTMDSWSYVDCGESQIYGLITTSLTLLIVLVLILLGLPTDVV
jgi:hypothetical protein